MTASGEKNGNSADEARIDLIINLFDSGTWGGPGPDLR